MVKVKEMFKQGKKRSQGKVERQGQGKINVRLRQTNHNHNHNYNLMGFDTIDISLVFFGIRKHFLSNKQWLTTAKKEEHNTDCNNKTIS